MWGQKGKKGYNLKMKTKYNNLKKKTKYNNLKKKGEVKNTKKDLIQLDMLKKWVKSIKMNNAYWGDPMEWDISRKKK